MTLKRVSSIYNAKSKTCLRCGYELEGLKDNVEHTCAHCGQKHLVDFYGKTLVLTAAERPELRHRSPEKTESAGSYSQKKKDQKAFDKGLERFRKKWGRHTK